MTVVVQKLHILLLDMNIRLTASEESKYSLNTCIHPTSEQFS